MKLLSTAQLREADAVTIKNESISSIDLMERAAKACAEEILYRHFYFGDFDRVIVFCGMGNNGGDGYAIARLLHEQNIPIAVFEVHHKSSRSNDCEANKKRLETLTDEVHQITSLADFPPLNNRNLVVDALLGMGINTPLSGILLEVVEAINASKCAVISVDMPTGLFPENNNDNNLEGVIHAIETLTFQSPKLALLLPDTGKFAGEFKILDIQLDADYLQQAPTSYQYLDAEVPPVPLFNREKFSHKGNFGHALFIGGEKGKAGAIFFAAKAALLCGAGLCTILPHKASRDVLQHSLPEAMTTQKKHPRNIAVIGIGPGLGKKKWARKQLDKALLHPAPAMVFDADALHLLSQLKAYTLPPSAIITPHVKELERLTACSYKSGFDRLQGAIQFSASKEAIVVLKGAHTAIISPDGTVYFNSTGTPALAKGGSGDILTGMITGLISRGYNPLDAAKLGVWLHGKAGELAAQKKGVESVLATDVINQIGRGFKRASPIF